MKILFVNNHGGGFADYTHIPHGTTTEELFNQRMGHAKPDHYLIRVNGKAAPRDLVLTEGNRVSITPVKIEAGRA
mgnify:CR=1 FL=1